MSQTHYRLLTQEGYDALKKGKAYPPDHHPFEDGTQSIDLAIKQMKMLESERDAAHEVAQDLKDDLSYAERCNERALTQIEAAEAQIEKLSNVIDIQGYALVFALAAAGIGWLVAVL